MVTSGVCSRWRVLVLFACLGTVPTSARAQATHTAATDEDLADAEARALFSAAVAAYDAGRYDDALESFERAYRRSQRPVLLYNMGQCYDRLRRDEEAVDAFERYLAAVPNAENRAHVEARIRALREGIQRRSAPPPASVAPVEVARASEPPPVTPVPDLREENPHRTRRAVLIATSAVVVVAAVVLTVVLAGGSGGGYVDSDVGTVFALRGGSR